MSKEQDEKSFGTADFAAGDAGAAGPGARNG